MSNSKAITKLIRSLGIGATYCGYAQLETSIRLVLEDEARLNYITKGLYPTVARECRTTVGSVERNIRTVVQICWERGYRERLCEIAGYSLHDRPSNGEFIDILANYIRMQEGEK